MYFITVNFNVYAHASHTVQIQYQLYLNIMFPIEHNNVAYTRYVEKMPQFFHLTFPPNRCKQQQQKSTYHLMYHIHSFFFTSDFKMF